MKKIPAVITKALGIILLGIVTYALVNSSLDIYNNFAYDKAILRNSPYGYVPMLEAPDNYYKWKTNIKGGEFVYVENWESARNGRIVFAKVKSKLNTGYINNKMLVEANINVMPVFSVLALGVMFVITFRKIYNIINREHCT